MIAVNDRLCARVLIKVLTVEDATLKLKKPTQTASQTNSQIIIHFMLLIIYLI